jgi:hypothetical protein
LSDQRFFGERHSVITISEARVPEEPLWEYSEAIL